MDFTIDHTACFAKMPLGECLAIDTGLHKNRCLGSDGCKFFKSCAQKAESDKRAFERIASLPDGTQQYIAEKYYHGKTPWLRPKA